MSITREEIEKNIRSCEADLSYARVKDREIEQRYLFGGEKHLAIDRANSGTRIKDLIAQLEKLKTELIEYDRDPVAFNRNRIKQMFSEKKGRIENIIDSYYKSIQECESTISYESQMNFRNSSDKIYAAQKMRERYQNSINQLNNELNNLKIEEYWTYRQDEKSKLENEIKTSKGQISVLERKISEIPKKIEGYADMLENQKKVQKLRTEKKSVSFFRFSEKNRIQKEIDAIEILISDVQSRVNTAIEVEQKNISEIKNKIRGIENELTKPR